MSVLVTGVAGFIGSYLARALLDRGEQVVGIDNFSEYYDPVLKFARLKPLRAERRFTEAEKLSRSTVAEMEGVFREGDPRLTRALGNYARLLAETNRTAQAKKVWARTLR